MRGSIERILLDTHQKRGATLCKPRPRIFLADRAAIDCCQPFLLALDYYRRLLIEDNPPGCRGRRA
jgi:hypothetical protein